MALFGIGRKKSPEVLDLTRKYGQSNTTDGGEKRPVKLDSKSSGPSGGFDFLSNLASSSSNSSSNKTKSDGYVSVSSSDSEDSFSNPDDKKSRLAKRLVDMTEKIEELSNQIYHLQQRLEVVERRVRSD